MKNRLTKTLFVTAFVFCALFMFGTVANAAPANQAKKLIVQPSGEKFYATTYGDEYYHWTVSDKGDVVVKANDGYWHYAQLSNGKLVATAAKYGISSKPFNAVSKNQVPSLVENDTLKGTALKNKSITNPDKLPSINLGASEKMIVFAVSFNDVKIGDILNGGNQAKELADLRDEMFGDVPGTVYNYYDTVSNGSFHFEKAVTLANSGNKYDGVVPVTLNYNHPNPDGLVNDGPDATYPTLYKSDVMKLQIVQNALKAVDGDIDFSQYDTNHDGWVSTNELHVVFVIAGYETSYGDVTPTVWAHSWCLFNDSDGDFSTVVDGVHMCELNEAEDPADPNFGKDSGKYTMQGEVHSDPGYAPDHLATIGTLCHELGHDCGLPDLYDYNYASQGVGILSIMASGSWASSPQFPMDGACPIQFDAFSKAMIGFVKPTVVTNPGDYTMHAFDSLGEFNILRINTADPKQYFLVENRQPDGFDAALGTALKSCGIIIYHVDETVYENAGGHRINDNIAHKAVDIEEADEVAVGYSLLDANISYRTTPYNLAYYVGNTTVFGDTSKPSSALYNGAKTGISVTAKSPSSDAMTVSVALGNVAPLTIVSIDPENGAVLNTIDKVTVTFANDIYPGFMTDPFSRTNSQYQFNKINLRYVDGGYVYQIPCNKVIKGNQLTLEPLAAYQPLPYTTYYVYIPKGSLKDAAGNFYQATNPSYSAYVSSFDLKDTTPPTVASIDPADKATNVALDKTISIKFNKIVAKSANFASIKLIDPDGVTVPAIITLNADSDTITIDPTQLLSSATNYTVVIPADAVVDTYDNSFAEEVKYTFTTQNLNPLLLVSSTPSNNSYGAMTNSSITLTFNREVKLVPGYSIVLRDGNGNTVACSVKVVGTSVVITPKVYLLRNTTYTLTIGDTSISDLWDAVFDGTTITFKTRIR